MCGSGRTVPSADASASFSHVRGRNFTCRPSCGPGRSNVHWRVLLRSSIACRLMHVLNERWLSVLILESTNLTNQLTVTSLIPFTVKFFSPWGNNRVTESTQLTLLLVRLGIDHQRTPAWSWTAHLCYGYRYSIFVQSQCSVGLQSRSVPIVYRAVRLCTKTVQSRFISLNVHQMAPFVWTKL